MTRLAIDLFAERRRKNTKPGQSRRGRPAKAWMALLRCLVLTVGSSLAVDSLEFFDRTNNKFDSTNPLGFDRTHQVLQPDVLEALETCSAIHESALADQHTRFSDHADPSPNYRGDKFVHGQRTPTFLFVHVGHACGGTITTTLAIQERKMRRELYPDEPGRAMFDTVHVHPVRKSVLNAAENVLISFRDPVDRFISAYNSNACLYGGDSRQTCVRPNNLQSDLPIMRLSMPMPGVAEAATEEMLNIKDPHGALGCFPNVTAFAEHLDDDSDCGRAARDVMHPPWAVHVKSDCPRLELLTPAAPPALAPPLVGCCSQRSTHALAVGPCYYLGGLIHTLQTKNVHVVHAETCNEDIMRIPFWLGLNLTFDEPTETHRDEFPHYADQPSAAGRTRLKRHLAHEYALQDAVEHMSRLSRVRAGSRRSSSKQQQEEEER